MWLFLRKPTATSFKIENKLKPLYYHFKTPRVHYVHSWVFKSDNTLVLIISLLYTTYFYVTRKNWFGFPFRWRLVRYDTHCRKNIHLWVVHKIVLCDNHCGNFTHNYLSRQDKNIHCELGKSECSPCRVSQPCLQVVI